MIDEVCALSRGVFAEIEENQRKHEERETTLLESVMHFSSVQRRRRVIKSVAETTRMTFSWKKEIKKRVEELLKGQDRFHERSPRHGIHRCTRAQKCIRMTSLIKAHDSVRT